MKKSVVAVCVIVVLGAVWTGGAWYSGKQLEKSTEAFLKEAGTYASDKLGIPLNVTIKNYQRGLLSTHFIIDVSPDKSMPVDVVIDHGPFPLARIGSGNILPAIATAKLTLVNNAVTKPLFDAAKGKSLIEAKIDFAYGGAISSDVTFVPAEYQGETGKLIFEGASYHVDVNSTRNDIEFEGEIDKITFSYKKGIEIVIPDATFSGHQTKSPFDFMTGLQKVDIGNITINSQGKPAAELNGFSLEGSAELSADGRKLNAGGGYTLASLKVQGQDFGSGKTGISFDGVDAAAFNNFLNYYRHFGKEYLQVPQAQRDNPDFMHERILSLAPKAVQLKKGEPVFKLPVSWKNAKGEATFNIEVQAADVNKAPDAGAGETAVLDSMVKHINVKLAVPVDMATEMAKNMLIVAGGKSEEAAQAEASKNITGLVGLGNLFKLIALENNTVKLDVNYSGGFVTMNGEKMTLDEFRQKFGRFGLPH
ncbi:YdgA family protein [Superficieibacter sp.]|uniref:YdgA family protein n=1 Tax=Superficieibacter sp. TaxID=2303322 RepID=UPI0028AFAC03|nr:YdgA family protein [Superficieibacter sp.]